MRARLAAWLRGFGEVFDWFPPSRLPSRPTRSDSEALRSDWGAVGSGMQAAIDRANRELRIVKSVMDVEDFYIVRLYDGMDNLWIDITKPISKTEADNVWNEHTDGGTKNTCYQHIDYYKIFPADTKMLYS